MVKKLSKAEKDAITRAIRAAEAHSGGEIATAITEQSGDWRAASLAFSIALSLLFSLIWWLLAPPTSFLALWLGQVALLVASELFFHVTGFGVWLVPAAVRRRAAARQARELFVNHGLHATENRAAILLFVSRRERYAELIADTGIAAKIDPATWRRIVEKLTTKIREDRAGEGFVNAIGECAALLHQHFPAQGTPRNALPDSIIEA